VPRAVLDTNVLVAAAYNPSGASRRVVDACVRREVVALLSPDLRREYELILARAVRGRRPDGVLAELLRGAEVVEVRGVRRAVPDDPGDDKVVALAVAGRADAVVTADAHLLRLDPLGGLRLVRPESFVRQWLGDTRAGPTRG
jgi:putative PIN family toxin of toxin-antitoxin system